MKRAVITGATGAIGMALIGELTKRGVEVLVFCRADSPRRARLSAFPTVTVLECGLDGLAAVDNPSGKTYDVFYHLAWAGTIGPSRNDTYLQNQNVKYALDAVGTAKRFGCQAFVGVGSQAEYGPGLGNEPGVTRRRILSPDTPTFPTNGYGVAKLCAGQLTRIACRQSGIRHIWPRILSAYGPYDSEPSLVTSLLRTLLAHKKPALTRGEQLWDYVYSKDVAKALYLLGEKGRDGAVYCLGSGHAQPLRSYIEQLRDMVDPDAELGFGELPYAPDQVMELRADISDLVRDTGYRPDTPFAIGAAETLAWVRSGQ